MEKRNLIISGNYNKMKMDRTKWYRVNYEEISKLSPSAQNGTMENINLVSPIPETKTETNKINEKVFIVDSKGIHEVKKEELGDAHITFSKPPKKDNIFSLATSKYGKERVEEAIAVVNDFVDKDYPQYMKRKHITLNKAQRVSFACKILDCENETEIDICNFAPMFRYMLSHCDKNSTDPTILYATTDSVLGYWLEKKYTDVEFYELLGTNYSPVEAAY